MGFLLFSLSHNLSERSLNIERARAPKKRHWGGWTSFAPRSCCACIQTSQTPPQAASYVGQRYTQTCNTRTQFSFPLMLLGVRREKGGLGCHFFGDGHVLNKASCAFDGMLFADRKMQPETLTFTHFELICGLSEIYIGFYLW